MTKDNAIADKSFHNNIKTISSKSNSSYDDRRPSGNDIIHNYLSPLMRSFGKEYQTISSSSTSINNNENKNNDVDRTIIDHNMLLHQSVQQQHDYQNHHDLIRHLTFWDLLGIGVGSTVGSGVFVLVGKIAHEYSGPSCWISMLIAGLASCCSGLCFAELSSRIPSTGSTYVYTKLCWNEYIAVIAAACLTLEYGISGAAVARTWGDKVLIWIQPLLIQQQIATTTNISNSNAVYRFDSIRILHEVISSWLIPGSIVNIPACLISIAATWLLLSGLATSKTVINTITLFKMIIVLSMFIIAFFYYDYHNMPPYVPFAPYGLSGIVRGSTISFFGFLGYDEVCCVAGEALHPKHDIPRAIIGTIIITTFSYVITSIALTGMISYTNINPTIGFPDAFIQRHVMWAATWTALGELITLPVVVVLCLLAQPRLNFSMAIDGLLPKIFTKVNADGNLSYGIIISGSIMTFIATFCPFTYLDDLISAGILVAFSITNSCLILLRCQPNNKIDRNHRNNYYHQNYLKLSLHQLLVMYNLLCFLSSLFWIHETIFGMKPTIQIPIAIMLTISTILCYAYIYWSYPPNWDNFGGVIMTNHQNNNNNNNSNSSSNHQLATNQQQSTTFDFVVNGDEDDKYFTAPGVPFVACLGIAINWYLISQLDWKGLAFVGIYLLFIVLLYSVTCRRNRNTFSINNTGFVDKTFKMNNNVQT